MTDPLVPVIEVWLQFYFSLPVAIQAFVSLHFGLILVTALLSLFFRTKH